MALGVPGTLNVHYCNTPARTLRTIVGRDGPKRDAASGSEMGRFETEWLATEDNLKALAELCGVWIDRVHDRKPPDGIVLDMDSSVSPTYGTATHGMREPHTVSLDPTGEVRLYSRKMAAWLPQRAYPKPRSRSAVPPLALLRGRGFLHDVIERILGLYPAPNGECRMIHSNWISVG